LPKDNEKDLPDIPEIIRRDMTLHFVESMDEVLRIALESPIDPAAIAANYAVDSPARTPEEKVTH